MHSMTRAIAIVLFFVSAQSFANNSCSLIMGSPGIPEADLNQQLLTNYDSHNVRAFRIYSSLLQQHPELVQDLPLNSAINLLLRDEELSTFHKRIERVLQSALTQGGTSIHIRLALRQELAKFLPAEHVEVRMALFNSGDMNKATAMRLFGGLTAEESAAALIGPSGIHNITSDSLVGRYLSQAAALGRAPSTLLARFMTGPDVNHATARRAQRGEEKLFISIDQSTLPLFQQLIANNPNYFIHNHTRGQGTLYMYHEGQPASYAKYHAAGPIGFGLNTLLPVMAVSTTEASRITNYMNLGSLTNSARSKFPWSFVRFENGRNVSYMNPGGYTCCTHWIGEMAFGDTMTSTYATFPVRSNDPQPLTEAPIGSYTHFLQQGANPVEIGNVSRLDRLTRMVWKQGQGHQQLWQILGLRQGMMEAELTNPGWTVYNLIASARADRVPVVFVMRNDARLPLTQADIDALRNSISPH